MKCTCCAAGMCPACIINRHPPGRLGRSVDRHSAAIALPDGSAATEGDLAFLQFLRRRMCFELLMKIARTDEAVSGHWYLCVAEDLMTDAGDPFNWPVSRKLRDLLVWAMSAVTIDSLVRALQALGEETEFFQLPETEAILFHFHVVQGRLRQRKWESLFDQEEGE